MLETFLTIFLCAVIGSFTLVLLFGTITFFIEAYEDIDLYKRRREKRKRKAKKKDDDFYSRGEKK